MTTFEEALAAGFPPSNIPNLGRRYEITTQHLGNASVGKGKAIWAWWNGRWFVRSGTLGEFTSWIDRREEKLTAKKETK